MVGTILLEWSQCEESGDVDWKIVFNELMPERSIVVWEASTGPKDGVRNDLEQVEFVVMWTIPFSELAKLPKLRAVLLLGAGTDHLKDLNTFASHIPIVRLVDDKVARDMGAYALHWVMHYHFCFDQYLRLQAYGVWRKCPEYVDRSQFAVGVMGMGFAGRAVCDALLAMGYRVLALSRSGRGYKSVQSFSQEHINLFAAECNAVVNVLPLTDETRGIVDASLLGKLRPGAIFINMGRGDSVVDGAVLDALRNGRLRAAVLDVFQEEPLPPNSPFWSEDKVVITPHVSGRPFVRSSVKSVVDNIRRLERGEQPFPTLDRQIGY
ncbi:Glyoxylate/hydroxypyruvate reductase A [Gracilariopsis chorda]|uniref:Glyoxylate/hydroxypyruvate reductase A n=1 Tax=Gracilariopsis chorda TaxID=448386 RepID=A0A2V3IDX1_9FLOR|nr:Glyoxylate/hydroxypyruvate reductase A [Gracilariopsis chorda]|eukprot:PXF40273.1 Glyoxylate/hydroxypyruvate reductase A [Gracilariopsis chorda]